MRSVVGALVVVGMLALSGCVDGDRIPTLPPTPTSTPIFSSEEEALAAAEAAYAAYNEMSNQVAQDGGANPQRLAPFVTEDQLEVEVESAAFYSENGVHSSGNIVVSAVKLQQYSATGDLAEVVIYSCLDVSGARLVDVGGVDRTPLDRPDVIALEVSFVGVSADSLLVASSDQWSDASFCS